MLGYLARRFIATVLTILVVATLAFVLLRVTSDPVAALVPAGADQEHLAEVRARLGLDRPILEQYWTFITGVATGGMGSSYRYGEPSMELVLSRAPATLRLAGAAMALALVFAIPLGILSAVKRNSIADYLASFGSFLGFAIPTFWLGTMLVLVFAVQLRWLPTSGDAGPLHLILPTLTLAMWPLGQLTRLVRSEMLDILREDYIRTARAQGLAPVRIVLRHALPNAMVAIVTMSGLLVGILLSGAVVTETIFAWPGLGRLVLEATLTRDFPVIEACVVSIAVAIGVVNFLVDAAYAFIDPRIRYS